MISYDDRERASDQALLADTRNTARYFVEHPQVGWVALALTIAAGIYGYLGMPKAKDPIVEPRMAVVTCVWPGAKADKIEQLITQRIERELAKSANVETLESISRTGVAIVYVTLRESIEDRAKEWNDLHARLATIDDLPHGTGPVQLEKDFGDTVTLMLAVASPPVAEVELDLRATAIARAIDTVRAQATATENRATLVFAHAPDHEPAVLQRLLTAAQRQFSRVAGIADPRVVRGPGFLGLDVDSALADDDLRERLRELATERLRTSELHPDLWPLVIVRDPARTRSALAAVATDRYTHRELDRFSEQMQKHLQRLPLVARVTRTGIVPERIYLEYSQARLASYGIEPAKLATILGARNITASGGIIEAGGKNVTVDPSGELTTTQELGGIVIGASPSGALLYLRDLLAVSREYESPPRFLSFLTVADRDGALRTRRAITLAVTMRADSQITEFKRQVDRELAELAHLLPPDLIVERTSDQPSQVEDNVDLFMRSLYETIGLVVLVALFGFWEWRTALLLALSIPITLAMTFALMFAWGLDLQQVSIASLIIALGLLVDDPVVASDAIKRSLALGWHPRAAAWLGPTKLARAIVFATLTNIAAYLPFLTVGGDIGAFLYSMPIVLALSLVSSRIVSMTFVPLLAMVLLRTPAHAPRTRGHFARAFHAVLGWSIDHRKLVFVLALGGLAGGGVLASTSKLAFFPKDLSNLSYVEVWLPEDASLATTREVADQARAVIVETATSWAKQRGRTDQPIESITSFVGGGGPRFWASVVPELPQLNYAQLVLELGDKHDTEALAPVLQRELAARIAGARVDVRRLETGKPIGIPIAVRISGENAEQLRLHAKQLADILRATPGAEAVRDDWGNATFAVRLGVDSDRANLAGVTNLDVAASSAAAMNGVVVGQLRDNDRRIDIVTRLRADERSQLSDIRDLYVMSLIGDQKVPLSQVSKIDYAFQTEKLRRRNQFRTITVSCFSAAGVLASEVLAAARPAIAKLEDRLAPGYRLEIAGEHAEQMRSLDQMFGVAFLMTIAIFVALVVQLKSAVKPLIVFAALPFGAVAAMLSLLVVDVPLGFMAILGIISLMGVIVSHVIVLFDFIEEMRERGAPMRQTLLDAGLVRLRPVLVTVVATVFGLIPLAVHGGPLWEPLCYAQIGGLTVATIITLFLVPVLYTIFILDLRVITWEHR